MDLKTARKVITAPRHRKPSELANAVDVFYQEFGTYQAITQEIGRSDKFWMMRHRIFQLPAGIRWKIDEGDIGIAQGYQISRLKREEDQWLLALAIIEAKGLTAKDCEKIVTLVLQQGKSIREALCIFAGIRFEKIQHLRLSVCSETWLAICKIAWARYQKWEDLCYELLLQGIEVDTQEVASQLEKLASELRDAGRYFIR